MKSQPIAIGERKKTHTSRCFLIVVEGRKVKGKSSLFSFIPLSSLHPWHQTLSREEVGIAWLLFFGLPRSSKGPTLFRLAGAKKEERRGPESELQLVDSAQINRSPSPFSSELHEQRIPIELRMFVR